MSRPTESTLNFPLVRPRDAQELFALLASVDVERLTAGERALIAEWFRDFASKWGGPEAGDGVWLGTDLSGWAKGYMRNARVWINDLIDGKSFRPEHVTPVWKLDGRRVVQTHSLPGDVNSILAVTILQPLFPYARCPQCRRIFVRKGRRRYCSPQCKDAWTESHRDPAKVAARRKWMKLHMRTVRAGQPKPKPAKRTREAARRGR